MKQFTRWYLSVLLFLAWVLVGAYVMAHTTDARGDGMLLVIGTGAVVFGLSFLGRWSK